MFLLYFFRSAQISILLRKGRVSDNNSRCISFDTSKLQSYKQRRFEVEDARGSGAIKPFRVNRTRCTKRVSRYAVEGFKLEASQGEGSPVEDPFHRIDAVSVHRVAKPELVAGAGKPRVFVVATASKKNPGGIPDADSMPTLHSASQNQQIRKDLF
ncbi:MAG: hypothetical protein P8103_15770 [Candidatus Thiodiazotropha sp.]